MNFTTGIWVDVVEAVIVGVGMGFMGAYVVGVVAKGWAVTLTLHLLFTGTLVLLFSHFVSWVFLVKELFLWEGVAVYGCDWVWD